jgi:hypothetical protein
MNLTSFNIPHVVPNAPCGVERELSPQVARAVLELFLMHRVELKVTLGAKLLCACTKFLMHRVELKAYTKSRKSSISLGS